MEWWKILLIVWAIVEAVASFFSWVASITGEYILPAHPGDLHYVYDSLNWFGATLIWFLWVIFGTLGWLIKFMIYVCTVGRK